MILYYQREGRIIFLDALAMAIMGQLGALEDGDGKLWHTPMRSNGGIEVMRDGWQRAGCSCYARPNTTPTIGWTVEEQALQYSYVVNAL
ncbi:hypothetical protein F8S13_11580 [Chloroflexia bacterium SDU3-3]|nr:hypothetical protein F8S13_11580 [Chloroflexia bacterium SDU3-3]